MNHFYRVDCWPDPKARWYTNYNTTSLLARAYLEAHDAQKRTTRPELVEEK
jgi:hypothetical protein